VEPARTGSLNRLEAPQGALAGAIRNLNPTLAAQLRDAWEALNNRWNQWVLNYTQGKQLDLLKSLGFASPAWSDLAYVLIAVVVLVSLAGAAWQLWERQQHDPWLRLLQRCRQRLRRLGLECGEHLPPRGLAEAVQGHFGDNGFSRAVTAWLLRLEAQRYARDSQLTLATLRQEFQQLAWPDQAPR